MRALQRWVGGVVIAALLGASPARAERAITKDPTRLREGPSAATELVAELPAGTTVEVLGESGGWKLVRTAGGRTGYAWATHLAAAEPKEPEATRVTGEPAATPPSVADQMRDLREQVNALAARPAPASAADLERLRQEVERLAAAERDLARVVEERMTTAAPADPAGAEGSLWTTAGFLAIGVAIVLVASWLLQRQRERRQRGRLRL